ncbi:uncharacterized protein LOC111615625, partial [Centruroides sculpturatus]|uniref:uncharacterized protein LOC111615625 n=1 Tax=Centruroides sculpturatus TaxID=218467 RepID=UPI000C6EC9BC
ADACMFLGHQEPVTVAVEECGVAPKTAVDWYNYSHKFAEVFFSYQQEMKLGSKEMHVETDETFTRRQKYNHGCVTKGTQITIFGAYSRETREVMYWHVDKERRWILWSHMLRYIAPGTIIVSDSAAQYRGCTTMGFSEHKTVNHRQRAPKDKEDKACNVLCERNEQALLKSDIFILFSEQIRRYR